MSDITSESSEYQSKYNQVMGLREQNASLAQQIEQAGGGVEVSSARTEHLLQQLVELGVITPMQMLDIDCAWEQHLRPQLKDMLEVITELKREQTNKKRIIVPGR